MFLKELFTVLTKVAASNTTTKTQKTNLYSAPLPVRIDVPDTVKYLGKEEELPTSLTPAPDPNPVVSQDIKPEKKKKYTGFWKKEFPGLVHFGLMYNKPDYFVTRVKNPKDLWVSYRDGGYETCLENDLIQYTVCRHRVGVFLPKEFEPLKKKSVELECQGDVFQLCDLTGMAFETLEEFANEADFVELFREHGEGTPWVLELGVWKPLSQIRKFGVYPDFKGKALYVIRHRYTGVSDIKANPFKHLTY